MSAYGMTRTVLATELYEAYRKDKEIGGFDISAGNFGPNISKWVSELAESINPKPVVDGGSSDLYRRVSGQ